MSTYGPAYSEKIDGRRVSNQMMKIRHFMLSVDWRSLAEIEQALNFPQASISACLRHFRKPRFGGYRVEKKRRSEGTWIYRVREPAKAGQQGGLW